MRIHTGILIGAVLLLLASSSLAQSACPPQGCGIDKSVIEAHRWPNVRPLEIKEDLIRDRDYRRIEGAFAIHTSPNSEDSEAFGSGFTFVTVVEQQGDWTRIGENQWVRSELLSESVSPSRFAGALLPTAEDALPFTVAWTLRHLRGAKTPGGAEAADNPFRYRYTQVYIYDTVKVDGYDWYQIGVDQWAHQFKVAKILPVKRPEAVDTHKWVSIDLYEQVAISYEDETPVFATLVSSGLEQWPTNEGLFHVYVRFTRKLMSGARNQPDFYYLQEVPWTMFYDDEIALHGAYWHDGFGFRRSHGCVNISVTDARWLFDWSQSEYDWSNGDYVGPAVYVYSSGEYD